MNVINMYVIQIDKASKDMKQKDILSLLFLNWIIYSFLFLFLFLVKNFAELNLENFLNVIAKFKSENFSNYMNSLNTRMPSYMQINIPFKSEMFVQLFLYSFISTVIILVVNRISKVNTFKSIGILFSFNIILAVLILKMKSIWLLMLLINFLLMAFIKIGDGKYFCTVKYLYYFTLEVGYSFQDYKVSYNWKKVTIVVVLNLLIGTVITSLINVPWHISIVLSLTITIILLINLYSRDTMKSILIKIILYIIFFVIAFLSNLSQELTLLNMFLVLSTFYMSIVSILSIFKEVKQVLWEKSVAYYLYDEDISLKKIYKETIPIKLLERIDVEESELVKQVLLRRRCNNFDEMQILCNLYFRKPYQYYMQLIIYLQLFCMGRNNSSDYVRERVKKALDLQNQRLVIYDLYVKYADIIYKNGEINSAEDLYSKYLFFLNKESLENYIYILRQKRKERELRIANKQYLHVIK